MAEINYCIAEKESRKACSITTHVLDACNGHVAIPEYTGGASCQAHCSCCHVQYHMDLLHLICNTYSLAMID